MSNLYFQRLQRLQKEISTIYKKRNKLNKSQKLMYDFVNNITKEVIFEFDNINIILRKGNDKKGFKHILLRHYCRGCDGEITTNDILNFGLICKKSVRLGSVGVTNQDLIVLQNTKTHHKIVLNEIDEKNFVVTFYSLENG